MGIAFLPSFIKVTQTSFQERSETVRTMTGCKNDRRCTAGHRCHSLFYHASHCALDISKIREVGRWKEPSRMTRFYLNRLETTTFDFLAHFTNGQAFEINQRIQSDQDPSNGRHCVQSQSQKRRTR